MGLFDWFGRRRPSEQPGDLRDALIAASSAQDFETLTTLINRNSDDIRRSFHEWLQPPAEVVKNPAAIQSYGATLNLVARLFERSGDSSLIQQMHGGNPLYDWQRRVEAAEAILDQGRAHEAVALLKGVLDGLDADKTIALTNFRPMVLGRLGAALVKAGNKREAIAVTRQALELCRTLGDEQGVQVYTSNLQAIGTFETPANDGTDQERDGRNQGRTGPHAHARRTAGRVRQHQVGGGRSLAASRRQTIARGRACRRRACETTTRRCRC